jgi:hypothetical protein
MTVGSDGRQPRRWLAYIGYTLLTVLSVVGALGVYVALVFIGR